MTEWHVYWTNGDEGGIETLAITRDRELAQEVADMNGDVAFGQIRIEPFEGEPANWETESLYPEEEAA